MEKLELKTARFTVLIDPSKKQALEAFCASKDITPSQVVRKLIRNYLSENGVTWSPAGSQTTPPASSDQT